MLGNFKLAHLGGITRGHEAIFRECERYLTLNGFICFAPVIYDVDTWSLNKEMLDDMCFEKLQIADLFVIVTADHIGKSTRLRMRQSRVLNIPVYIYEYGKIRQLSDEEIRKILDS